MLVLSRHIDEEIVITTPAGERISVMLVQLRGDKARIGITAPRDCQINRREIQDVIDAARRDSGPDQAAA